ncbi:imidazole glycerol phosphate synthase subunit HisH [Methanosphaera sp. BMS]|uniref:imidazole glycerol phosphate synthase subunit HisH n=1 Tax=Methanosphaera sp. BMS TaxID=1789762 RepID=UPI001F0220E6|nr:imidazole glycerol phosphate synthase subunit HisH [Methanosphaera sp. BMS]
MSDITILDYGSGNILSIYNGFKKIGVDVNVSDDEDVISKSDAIILPGVGAYGAVMNNLDNYRKLIYEHVDNDKPLLGICLGLQVLFTSSEESPDVEGLNIFEGSVKRFDLPDEFKIPHMGWNQIKVNDTPTNDTTLLDNVDGEYMYFVHSYYIEPDDENLITSTCDYGMNVPVSIGRDNVHALQFHPEKSGKAGLEILKNFVDII